MSAAMKHIPVMFAEVMDALAVREGGRYIDGTLGRGGHAAGIAGRGGVVLGIDRDMAAVEACRAKFAQGGAVKTVHGAHGDIAEIAKREGFEGVDGVLLDLGVSSPQLDDPARGFSFRNDGPLDMRMDRTKGESAAELVARASAEELADILRRFGEEPQAKRIAQAIVRRRGERAFETTGDLADFVEKIAGRHGGKHPATRTFQALRMAVNDEEGELARALEGAVEVLARGGRLCVITFESLTDRMVKRFMRSHEGDAVALPQGGSEWRGEMPRMRCVVRRAIKPSEKETEENPRARSAKLRVAEKI